ASPLPRPPRSTLFPYTTLFRSAQTTLVGGGHLQSLPLRRRRGKQQHEQDHRETLHGFAPSNRNATSAPPERSSTCAAMSRVNCSAASSSSPWAITTRWATSCCAALLHRASPADSRPPCAVTTSTRPSTLTSLVCRSRTMLVPRTRNTSRPASNTATVGLPVNVA